MPFDESPRRIGVINKMSTNPDAYLEQDKSNLSINKDEEEETPAEVAALLASISTIASREIKDNSSMMKELAEIAFPDLSRNITTEEEPIDPVGYEMQSEELMNWHYCDGSPLMPIKHRHRHYRGEERKKRTISMDSPVIEGPNSFEEAALPTLLHHFDYCHFNHHNHDVPFKNTSIAENVKTKYSRPRSVSVTEARSQSHARQKKKGGRRHHTNVGNAVDLTLNGHVGTKEDKPMKLVSTTIYLYTSTRFFMIKRNCRPLSSLQILRKKFSWKNYPDVGALLLM